MSTTDVNGSELDVTAVLPAGTVTLLLADVEGSTGLWETQPEAMTAAIARLDATVTELIAAHGGVRPVEQGEGDSFVVAFTRGSDAVGCALELQRAPLAPIRLRIGVHTGEIQLRDEGNYVGSTVNRAARIRDLAHGGQTLLSGATEYLVADRLPDGAWLTDMGSHALRGMARPERVVQLCHPDIGNDFPPLRTSTTVAASHLPVQLTTFVGRAAQIAELLGVVADNRLVTLTGAGGVGKTRLAIEVAGRLAAEFPDGVWAVDLAPITDPELVPAATAAALGVPNQPGRPPLDSVRWFVGGRRMLILLDNCEHLLDATADLAGSLLAGCPAVRLLATSREPIGLAGEVSWRVPSLPLADEAIELFADRARRARADFAVDADNAGTVTEICHRLDGMPLAIELAAARVRALTLAEILDSLHDRFRLLTGGTRTAVRRQQTLRASVDWSHALLTEPERVLFRRLAVFVGGCDLDGARAVAAADDVERYQMLDQLSLLVDKSLVVADDDRGRTRYRMLETVRQYALEKLGESGEADAVRIRHRDHYTALAAELDTLAQPNYRQLMAQAETEIDNLRAAFVWSQENADVESALRLASALYPIWVSRGHMREGLNWLDVALPDDGPDHPGLTGATWARAQADKARLASMANQLGGGEQLRAALAIAREVGDPDLLLRVLAACGATAATAGDPAGPYLAEAAELARQRDDPWQLGQILAWQQRPAYFGGDPVGARAAAAEGARVADAVGDRFVGRACRWGLGFARMWTGELAGAAALFGELVADADADADAIWSFSGRFQLADALVYLGDTDAAYAVADAATAAAVEVGGTFEGYRHLMLGLAALGAGDTAAANGFHSTVGQLSDAGGLMTISIWRLAATALATRDLAAARRFADDAVAVTTGWHLMIALTTRARVALAQADPAQADRDAHEALAIAVETGALLGLPGIFECLARLAADGGEHQQAARLYGAAEAVAQRTGEVRLGIYESGYQESVAAMREALGENDFAATWAEGAALSTGEAIGYAQRGRGERRRASTGWQALTPAELDVVRLVGEGLANKDIAARLFVSPRTVESHLNHVYTKLGLSSRVQLAQEAGRHS